MYLIGLTGGIAAGKSLVSRQFADLGAVVIDADQLAREVVEPGTPGLAQIAQTFGPSVITAAGELDRAALGAIVFAESDRLNALNAITHPSIRALARLRIDEAAAADPGAVVVYDVALLTEKKIDHGFDLVVVVEAAGTERARRMMSDRGMSDADAAARIASQATDAERRVIADVVIENSGRVEETLAQVDALFARVKAGLSSGG